jgi:hypothetical protein
MRMPWEISETAVSNAAIIGLKARDVIGRYGNGRLRRFVGQICPYCLMPMTRIRGCSSPKAPSRDHRVPLCRGGLNVAANILICCRQCNEEKGPLDEEEFAAVREGRAVSLEAWWMRLRTSNNPPKTFPFIHYAKLRMQLRKCAVASLARD